MCTKRDTRVQEGQVRGRADEERFVIAGRSLDVEALRSKGTHGD